VRYGGPAVVGEPQAAATPQPHSSPAKSPSIRDFGPITPLVGNSRACKALRNETELEQITQENENATCSTSCSEIWQSNNDALPLD